MNAAALASALRQIGAGFVAAAEALEQPASDAAGDFVALRGTPYYRAALEAVRAGELRAVRLPGTRATLVDRAELDRWLEQHHVKPVTAPVKAEPEQDYVDKVLEINRVRRRSRGAA